ncbi:hypothetical protein [Streptomyces sp. NPDC003635]
MTPVETRETTADRRLRAAESAGRAGGYCWMEHPESGVHCTRRPHSGRDHVNYFRGRESPPASHGFEWQD